MGTTDPEDKSTLDEMTCPTGSDYCIKIWYDDNMASRSCGSLGPDFPDNDCKSMEYDGKSADVCTCKTDLCNGAFEIAPMKTLALVAVAVLTLLFNRA